MLDRILPAMPYPIRGAIIRAIRVAIAILLAGLAASIADGSIIAGLSFLPPEYVPVVIMLLTVLFTGVDKWLRERGLVEDDAAIPLNDNVDPAGKLPADNA